nr:MAG TPA: hypothetical protein [Caudoviricetes sp.]
MNSYCFLSIKTTVLNLKRKNPASIHARPSFTFFCFASLQ